MPPPQDTPARILVVEDERAIRDLIVMLLSDEGYEAMVAPNGAVALESPLTWCGRRRRA